MKTEGHNKKPVPVARIALYYTISNIFARGMIFLSTPIFTRIMTKVDYGKFSNFTSWKGIIYIIATFSLYSAVGRAKFDFKDSMAQYVCSTMLTSNIVTLLVWVIVECNRDFFTALLSMEISYIRLIFLIVFFEPSFDFLMRWYRSVQKYQFVVAVSILLSVMQTLVGVLFVVLFQDKFDGRVKGYIYSSLVIYIFLWIYIVLRGKCFHVYHAGYALKMSIPLIFHSLSGVILVSADRIMITSLCGSEYTALYVVPYNVSQILSVVWNSMEQAWAPWLFDQLSIDNTSKVREVSKKYVILFCFIVVGALLIGPEAVWVLGGREYYETRYIMPPVMMALMFQFLYSLYADIELYCKKTINISIATIMAAVLNLLLNQIFIGLFGYTAAAYTTLIGYMAMFVFHCINVYRIKRYTDAYDLRFILVVIIMMFVVSAATLWLYKMEILRYLCLCLYLCILLIGIYKYRNILVKRD